jgi:hypothetical protein
MTQPAARIRATTGDDGRVGLGHEVDAAGPGAEEMPARRGRQAGRVHRVLDHHGHAGDRSQCLTGRMPGIDGAGIGQGIRIPDDEGIPGRGRIRDRTVAPTRPV